MSRKLYLPSTGAPGITPAYDAGWSDTSSATRTGAVWDVPSATAFASVTVNAPALPDPSALPYTKSYVSTVLVRQYISPPIISTWAATTAFVVGQIILDPSGHPQQVTVAGTSGGSAPAWDDTGTPSVPAFTSDGTVTWTDLGAGPLTAKYITGYVRSCAEFTGGGGLTKLVRGAPSVCKIVNSSGVTQHILNPLYPVPANATTYLPNGSVYAQDSFLQPATPSLGIGGYSGSNTAAQTIFAGDRIVIEIGYAIRQFGAHAQVTAADATLEFGDAAASDLSLYGPNSQLNPIFYLGTPSSAPVPPPTPPPFIPGAWLIINEPSVGITDRSQYLDFASGQQTSFQAIMRQRGTATIAMRVKAGDTYAPTTGTQVFQYDVTAAATTLVYAGTIDKISESWDGNRGDRLYSVSAVSFEQCFDAVKVPPTAFINQTAGSIITSLYNSLMAGAPVTLGVISPGRTIPSLVISDYPNFSDILNQLATTCLFVWGVDPATQTLYFRLPSTTPAPFSLVTKQVLWESAKWEQNRQDFRDRQIVRISPDAFAHSSELFTGNGSARTFTLRNPPNQIANAWITKNTQNTATATFTANPANGDTATISYPASGSIYDWAANAPYDVGQIIIDRAGHVQACTTQGTSGGSYPAFSGVLGSVQTDGPGTPNPAPHNGAVIWTDRGISGGGSFGASIYTFVTALDNRQWGQVLIGATAAATAQNFADAINAKQAKAGITFSLPTWENPLVNADAISGSHFTIRNKSAGAGYIAGLTASAASFAWSGAFTSGGSTTGGTVLLQVAIEGSSNTANLYYTPGSSVVKLASLPSGSGTGLPLSSSWFLQAEYTRLGGDCIVVEDTALVASRAAIESGTGKYQQISSDTSNTSNAAGLLEAQQALAAYSTIPISFSFDTLTPGISPGQYLTITMSDVPTGIAGLVNGNYVVQEVQGQLIEGAQPWLDEPGAGHYRYTVTVINVGVIGSYLDFWQGLGGSSGGSSASGPVLAGASPAGGAGSGGTGITALTITAPSEVTVAGSPTTGATPTIALSWTTEAQGRFFSGPISGGGATPTFRALDIADLSTISQGNATLLQKGLPGVSGNPVFYDVNFNLVPRSPRGSGTVVQLADSTTTPTSGNLVSFDATGNTKDSGHAAAAFGFITVTDGAATSTRPKIDVIAGANIGISVADDVTGNQAKLTIASSMDLQVNGDTGMANAAGTNPEILFAGAGGISVAVTISGSIVKVEITSSNLQAANNLSDVANGTSARTNLGAAQSGVTYTINGSSFSDSLGSPCTGSQTITIL